MPVQGRAAHAPSWYAATAGDFPSHPELKGAVSADVVVIGAGFTGLSAALTLAKAGRRVIVLEANKVGWGASGRNGGQIHPGQRQDPDWLAARIGEGDTRKLLKLAEAARSYQRQLITDHAMDVDLVDGLIHAVHKARWVAGTEAHAARMNAHWGIKGLTVMNRAETAERLGTDVYFGAVRDAEGGHLHPLKFALGLARAASVAGAMIHEDSCALTIEHGAKVTVTTTHGRVTADHLILAGNGYLGGLDAATDARVMPLNNFILATRPLDRPLIVQNEAASDTRFVVYYWRQTPDGRLLFGGGENFSPKFPRDIEAFVRKHMARIYPQLANIEVDYAWGGTLGITVNRMPYVGRPRPNVWVAAGYSGQGVMLAPFAGHLLAQAITGTTDGFDIFSKLPTPPFPGGPIMRWPTLVAAMSWFALMDRI